MSRIVFRDAPKCSTKDDFGGWLMASRHHPPGRAGFCEDCAPGFAAKMRVEGRCEHPEVRFDENGDGYVRTLISVRQLKEPAQRAPRRAIDPAGAENGAGHPGCTTCGREFHKDEFYTRVRGERVRYLTVCKECHKAYVKNRGKKK